jgi:hypothetical protein
MYNPELSWLLKLIKTFSGQLVKITDVSGAISVPHHQGLMWHKFQTVPETSVIFNQLTQLIAREDFIRSISFPIISLLCINVTKLNFVTCH